MDERIPNRLDQLTEALEACRRKLDAARHANDQLQTERLQLTAVVDGSRDAIWSWDTGGRILRWNAAAERLFGYTRDEIIGRSLLELVPPERYAIAREVLDKIRQGNWYSQYTTIRMRKDGSPVPVELTVSPVLDIQGKVIGGSTVCRDITERQQFESSLAKRVRELTTLYELTDRLQLATSLQETFDAALDALAVGLGCERASILLHDSSNVMRFVAWRGLSDSYRTAVEGHSPWKPDTFDPKAIFVANTSFSDEYSGLKDVLTSERIKSLAFVPLLSNGKLIGKFMVYSSVPHDFSADEINLINAISRQLSSSVVRQTAEADLKASEARFRIMAESAPVMIWISDVNGHCLHLNQMLRTFWGVEEDKVSEFNWGATMHPEDAPIVGRLMTEALDKQSEILVKGRYLNAQNQYRWLETNAAPRFSPSGKFIGMIGVNIDVTEREEAEKARDLLVAELNHRVKNTLSVVQGIAHQTFRENSNSKEARRSFEGRLVALAHAHNLLTSANWDSASLESIAELILDAKGANCRRVLLSGPAILLPPKEAVSIAMALHELCTNARKYGALSNESGQITLHWIRSNGAQPRLKLDWLEQGGPPVTPPTHKGFGSFLLQRTLAQDLQGEVRMEFKPDGLVCSIGAPLKHKEGPA